MRAKIDSLSFGHIEVYKCGYELEKNNSGPVICRDCRGPIAPGLGIHRRAYKRNGYLCFSCFSKDVTVLTKTPIGSGDAGFFVDSLGRLRACMMSRPTISTPEVLEAVYRAMLDEGYTVVDILLGGEVVNTWTLLDAAEAVIGK